MRIDGICIVTRDVRRLAMFYGTLFGIEPRGDGTFADFAAAGAHLSLFAAAAMERMAPGSTAAGPGGHTLEVEVDAPEQVDREYHRLGSLGVAVLKPPTTQAWGRRSVWLRDPDGNIVNVYARTGAASSGAASPHADRAEHTTGDTGDAGAAPAPVPAERVEAWVRDYFERLLNRRELWACDELLAPDYRDHDAPADSPPGPAATRAYLANYLRQYPDLRVRVEDVIVDGVRAAARVVWRGTHGDTGQPLNQRGVVMLRLNGRGQLAERWSGYAPLG